MKTPKILIAEDEKDLSELYKGRLELESYEVLIARDGLKALSIVKKEKPDLMLLDIMMPEKDGLEVLRFVRGELNNKDIKIIMLSVLPNKEIIEKAMDAGADKYLIKSKVTPGEVVSEIKKLLKNGQE